MADNKTLEFGAEMKLKDSPSMERAVKKYSSLLDLSKRLKQMEEMDRAEVRWTRVAKNNSLKVMEEKNKLWDQINKRVAVHTKLYEESEKIAERWYQKRKARGDSTFSEAYFARRGTTEEAFHQQQVTQRAAAIRSRSLAAMTAAAEIGATGGLGGPPGGPGDPNAVNPWGQRLYAAGIWAQAFGAAAKTIGGFATVENQRLEAQVAKAELAGQLYREIAANDYSSLWAMKGGRAFDIARMGLNARTGKELGLIGDISGGLGTVGVGGALALGTGGLGGAYGAQTAMGGIAQAGGGVVGFMTGAQEVAMANEIRASIERYKNLDPIKRAQWDAFNANVGSIQQLGALSGGIGREAFKAINSAALEGGMTGIEAMPIWNALRSGIGVQAANRLTGTVAASEMRYGVARGDALGALTALSGMQGGASQAEARLEKVMARATKAGMDATLGARLATSMPGLMQTIAGRGSDVGIATSMIATQAVALGGGEANAQTLGMAQEAFRGGSTMYGTGSGIQALNVAQSGNIARVASKYGLSRTLTLALVQIGDANQFRIAASDPNSRIYQMVAYEKGEQAGAILRDLSGGAIATFNAFMGGMTGENPMAAATVIAQHVGMSSAESVEAAQRMQTGGLGPMGPEAYRLANTGSQAELNAIMQSNAVNRILPLLQAMADPKLESQLLNLARAGTMISVALDNLSKTDPARLQQVLEVLGMASGAIDGWGGGGGGGGGVRSSIRSVNRPNVPSQVHPAFSTASSGPHTSGTH